MDLKKELDELQDIVNEYEKIMHRPNRADRRAMSKKARKANSKAKRR